MKMQKCLVAASVVFLAAVVAIAFPENAQAGYIDSGSGSALVQVLIAAAAGVGKLWHSFRRALGLGK